MFEDRFVSSVMKNIENQSEDNRKKAADRTEKFIK